MNLNGKVAVVSGAGSGIGRGLAQLLVSKGAQVAITDINEVGLQETVGLLGGGHVLSLRLDVADREAVHAFARKVESHFGRADVVIANAGVDLSQKVVDTGYDDFEWLMNINFWGVVHHVKAFLPGMLERNEGAVVNISSLFGLIGWPCHSAYVASKFAVRGYTETLRHELKGTNVKAICVHPGGVATNIVKSSRYFVDDAGRADKAKMEREFNKVARTSPDRAARIIVEAVEKGRERVMVGRDASALDRLQRWMPSSYFKVIRAFEGFVRE